MIAVKRFGASVLALLLFLFAVVPACLIFFVAFLAICAVEPLRWAFDFVQKTLFISATSLYFAALEVTTVVRDYSRDLED